MHPSSSPSPAAACGEPLRSVAPAPSKGVTGRGVRLIAGLAGAALSGSNLLLACAERLLFPGASPRTPARVGVLRVGMVGDLAATWPALEALGRRYPSAELVLFTSSGPQGAPGGRELFGGRPGVDRVITWSRGELRSSDGRRAVLARCREAAPDLIVGLPQEHGSPRGILRDLLFFRLVGARRARGFRLGGVRWLGERVFRAHAAVRSATPEHLRLQRLAGCETPEGPRGQAPTGPEPLEAERQRVRDLLHEHGLHELPLLVLSPGAKLPTKRWPTRSFGELARTWSEAGGVACVLGAPAERELAEQVVEHSDRRAINLAGCTNLPEAVALLQHAALHVTNDSGPMHLGALAGCPQVALFSGFGERGAWLPHGGRTAVLRGAAPCEPCLLEQCLPSAGFPELGCLTGIRPAAVLNAAKATAAELPAGLLEPAATAHEGSPEPLETPRTALPGPEAQPRDPRHEPRPAPLEGRLGPHR